MVISVAENDVSKLQKAIEKIGKSIATSLKFEHEMNILNLAIDQESVEIVQFLSEYYKNDADLLKSLVHHRYSKNMQAIH